MKILFLDFDGVITTYESGWRIDLKKLELLQNIIKSTDAKIVVTSSWTVGKDNVDDFKDYLCNTWRNKTIGENDIFKEFVRQIYDITDKRGAWRGDEIERWLDEHEDNVDTYAILDDDSDFHDNQLFHFVQTDTYEGLTAREAKLCTYILNNNKVPNPIRLNLELITRWRNKCHEIDDGGNIDKLMQEYYNRKFDKK
jgi:hypothetical protein